MSLAARRDHPSANLRSQFATSSCPDEKPTVAALVLGKAIWPSIVPMSRDLHPLIRTIRDQRVMLDADLARIYGVATKRFKGSAAVTSIARAHRAALVVLSGARPALRA